jgi:hypothetical protein
VPTCEAEVGARREGFGQRGVEIDCLVEVGHRRVPSALNRVDAPATQVGFRQIRIQLEGAREVGERALEVFAVIAFHLLHPRLE